jgi:adenylate cyclase
MPTHATFPLSAALRARLDRIGQEFLAEFYGREVARHPDNLAALTELADLLTRLGRLEEGLSADERLVALAPEDPNIRYNLACSQALLGRTEHALDTLERAVELGYDDAAHLLEDEDLASLRGERRFRAIVAALSGELGEPGDSRGELGEPG